MWASRHPYKGTLGILVYRLLRIQEDPASASPSGGRSHSHPMPPSQQHRGTGELGRGPFSSEALRLLTTQHRDVTQGAVRCSKPMLGGVGRLGPRQEAWLTTPRPKAGVHHTAHFSLSPEFAQGSTSQASGSQGFSVLPRSRFQGTDHPQRN